MELTSWKPAASARYHTPPESPHLEQAKLPPIRTIISDAEFCAQPGKKMSLDFITSSNRPEPQGLAVRTSPSLEDLSAAAAIHGGSRSSSPMVHLPINYGYRLSRSPLSFQQPVPKYDDYYGTHFPAGLPSPVCSEPRHLEAPIPQWTVTVPIHQPRARRNGRGAKVLYSPRHTPSYRVQKTSAKAPSSRCPRNAYDAEEAYALLYLRRADVEKKTEWKRVLDLFHRLFPRGHPRRYKATSTTRLDPRGLPVRYEPRDVGGLQCKYYRLRAEEGMPTSREEEKRPDSPEKMQEMADMLEKIAIRDGLSREFLMAVEMAAGKTEFAPPAVEMRSRL